jgi:hypothetical protein
MKPGNQVLCINAALSYGKLQTNAIYEVAKIETSFPYMCLIKLVGPCTDLWDQDRFRLMEQVNEASKAPCRREDTQKS